MVEKRNGSYHLTEAGLAAMIALQAIQEVNPIKFKR